MNAVSRGVVFAVTPLAFNRGDALAYTGLSEKLFSNLEKAGSLTARKIGKNGEAMYYREQLDRVAASLYGSAANDIDDEFGLDG